MKIDEEVLFSQIKYLGILDTIKIKKMGYCIKVKYEDMDRRFCWLVRRQFHIPAFSNEIKEALAEFLPRFGEEEFLYGKNKIFFKDEAYGVLLKKYIKYVEYLNHECHLITSLFVRHHYVKKKQKKKERINKINRYIMSFLEEKKKLAQI